MGITRKEAVVGKELPLLVKHMTQEKINLFSGRGAAAGGGFHTSAEAARAQLGMESPIASGQMSLGYAAQMLRDFFGDDVYHRSGSVDLRFTKPVINGDTVNVKGKITETKPEGRGLRVTVELLCENQNGERTATGAGSVLLP